MDVLDDDAKRNSTRIVDRPRTVRHFTLTFEEWQKFYNHKAGNVVDDWTNQLAGYLRRAAITCTVAFAKHHVRKIDSRKKNTNLFTCKGRCTNDPCDVTFVIFVEQEPKNRDSPAVFTVYILGHPDHSGKAGLSSRPITGGARVAMGRSISRCSSTEISPIVAQQVNRLGPLGAFERNMRLADENLLEQGNWSEVPSIDVLKTIAQEYKMKYRLDEDMFKEVRIFREITEQLDQSSSKVKGKYYFWHLRRQISVKVHYSDSSRQV